MSSDLAFELVLCGALLAGLSVLARHLQPDFPLPTLCVGLAGGGLCVLWGVLGGHRRCRRVGAMVTTASVACLMAWQGVHSWADSLRGEPNARIVTALMTVLVVVCIGTCANLVHEATAPPTAKPVAGGSPGKSGN